MSYSMDSPQPILQHGKFRGSRKYGRYDFERFDHLSSTHASIGHSTFDKVNIDCRFLFKKSKWGVLGEQRSPAGIVYLDLTFDQPKGCQLDSATVSITLDDEDRALREFSDRSYRGRLTTPIQMTDCYGPKGFAGPEKFVQTKKSLHLTPKADVLGYGFGGIGTEKESIFMTSSRWKFSGTLLPGKGHNWVYKTLKWDLSENDLEAQSTHSSKIHTAFTFEHSGQPFFMKVEIKGKLKKLHGRLKDRLMKFPSRPNKEEDAVMTLIKFGDRLESFTTPLDERARDLPFEMEIANLNAIPMEVSDPKPANFVNISQSSECLTTGSTSTDSKPMNQAQSQMNDNQPYQPLPASAPSHLPQGRNNSVVNEEEDPMIVDLARAFVNLQTVNRPGFLQEEPVKFCSTRIENGEDKPEMALHSDEISSKQKSQEMSEEQMLLRLLKMPAFVIFIRLIAGLLGLLGKAPEAIATDADEEEDDQQMPQRPNRSG